MLRKFDPPGFPANPAYSHIAEVTGAEKIVFIAGQVGIRPDGSIPSSMAEQTEIVIASIRANLEAVGMTPADVTKFGIFITDESLIGEFSATAGKYLPSPPPPSTLLVVKALAMPGLLVEVEAYAAR